MGALCGDGGNGLLRGHVDVVAAAVVSERRGAIITELDLEAFGEELSALEDDVGDVMARTIIIEPLELRGCLGLLDRERRSWHELRQRA